jgi:hypothetical protein
VLLAAGNHDVERQPVRIDHGVDFCRQPSTGTSKTFAYTVPDAARVLMCANDRAVDHLNFGIVPMRDGGQNTIPDPSMTPSNKSVVAGGIGAVALRQITPRRSRPQDPENAIEHPPVIHTRDTSRPARQDRANQPPFGVGWSVSHVQGSFSELESRRHAKLQCLLWHPEMVI